jgi:hypothetical protein
MGQRNRDPRHLFRRRHCPLERRPVVHFGSAREAASGHDTIGFERSTDKTSHETSSVGQRLGSHGPRQAAGGWRTKNRNVGRGFESLPCYRGSINRVAARHFAVCVGAILLVFFPFREGA